MSDEPVYQIDLFSLVDSPKFEVVEGRKTWTTFSNSIGSIDLVPRFKRGNGSQIRTTDVKPGENLTIENRYQIQNNELICEIKPALITKKVDGEEQEFHAYPSDKEELIEKVLFYIAANKGLELRAMPGGVARYGVSFSLYEIREVLKKINKTKPYDLIRQSLIILRDSSTLISQKKENNKITITHDVFADAALEVQGKGKDKDRCFITFSDFVVRQIESQNYRQYPFEEIQTASQSFARFIHLYMLTNYKQLNYGDSVGLNLEKIAEAFGKSKTSENQKKRDLRAALKVLSDNGTITHVPNASNKGGETYYFVEPTEKFIANLQQSEQKYLELQNEAHRE
ncbi:hypothetical protein [Thalassotalea marina]|uniref:Uncharacterized protein n=1 Tax=Thalassotalea marina TaxID=1673741 RepID=A0A919BSX8_9GAMM|nr:hypothetical protein [Thalassotalea marina]GHG07750.1 hypothetical protein GCM10017161_41820 [Thalassotalea marina]